MAGWPKAAFNHTPLPGCVKWSNGYHIQSQLHTTPWDHSTGMHTTPSEHSTGTQTHCELALKLSHIISKVGNRTWAFKFSFHDCILLSLLWAIRFSFHNYTMMHFNLFSFPVWLCTRPPEHSDLVSMTAIVCTCALLTWAFSLSFHLPIWCKNRAVKLPVVDISPINTGRNWKWEREQII